MESKEPKGKESNKLAQLREKAKVVLDKIKRRSSVMESEVEARELDKNYEKLKKEAHDLIISGLDIVAFGLLDDLHNISEEDAEYLKKTVTEATQKLDEIREYERNNLGMNKDSKWLSEEYDDFSLLKVYDLLILKTT